jgi:putative DNA-invertase from lambdoid prophage Rac
MPDKQITAAIYVRVSSVDQNDDLQFEELRSHARRMGWSTVEYVEKISAVKIRPELNRMMADARLRKFDIVVVWKLDRFARSLRQLIDNIQLLDSYGIRFIAQTQGIDTDKNNPASRLMLHILGAVAEFERGLITERVRAGVKEAQRRGKHCGRPKRIYKRAHLVELRASGLSLRAIAAKTGLPLTTVADALRVK